MRSRIIVDSGRASTLNSGLGQVVYHFAEALAENHPDDMDFTFLIHRKMEAVFKSNFNFKTAVPGPVRRLFPGAFPSGDIWHVLNPDSRSVPLRHPRIVVTLHDLRILVAKHGNRAAAYRKHLQRIVEKAAGLTAISEFTREGMRENFNIPSIPFEVIRNGISAPRRTDIDSPSQAESPYLFAIGIFEEKKRFHLLVEMMRYLPELDLYLAGFNDNAYGNKVKQLAVDLGMQERIRFPGIIGEDLKWKLYADCEALVFPSDLEGFGLPVLEAMALGRPVFISQDGALPEIGGALANYFSTLQPKDMAAQIRASMTVDQQTSVHDREDYARSFTWRRAVEQYLDFYRSILG